MLRLYRFSKNTKLQRRIEEIDYRFDDFSADRQLAYEEYLVLDDDDRTDEYTKLQQYKAYAEWRQRQGRGADEGARVSRAVHILGQHHRQQPGLEHHQVERAHPRRILPQEKDAQWNLPQMGSFLTFFRSVQELRVGLDLCESRKCLGDNMHPLGIFNFKRDDRCLSLERSGLDRPAFVMPRLKKLTLQSVDWEGYKFIQLLRVHNKTVTHVIFFSCHACQSGWVQPDPCPRRFGLCQSGARRVRSTGSWQRPRAWFLTPGSRSFVGSGGPIEENTEEGRNFTARCSYRVSRPETPVL
ncbi:hypothetical protein B0H66DRAFT_613594 [Apodospora peruviana]|uniref:Uncharacterized protein n=1 Tax=Apodospora peruviana TaxID=516989 RepID=A0AAE0MG55_9PEZI|nr:hypothetical protein B0H66DRAFT_613594 [Apodospora peruviana]